MRTVGFLQSELPGLTKLSWQCIHGGEGQVGCSDTCSYSCADCFTFTVSAVHKETKQFFTLYNTLDDKKVYLEKEVRTFMKRKWLSS